jgi:hypothetical protein
MHLRIFFLLLHSHAHYGHGEWIRRPSSCLFASNGDNGLEACSLQHCLGAEPAALNGEPKNMHVEVENKILAGVDVGIIVTV